jgi:hypothetical protein
LQESRSLFRKAGVLEGTGSLFRKAGVLEGSGSFAGVYLLRKVGVL